MKKIVYILLIVSSISCKAQLVDPLIIVPIENYKSGVTNLNENTYIKDTNNVLNQFVGTWNYTNGSTSLTIVLKKAINNNNGYYHEDIIYGEYQYIENGQELINTLSNIDSVYTCQCNHSISGNTILVKNARQLPCIDCSEDEKRLFGKLSDVAKQVTGRIYLRRITTSGGQPALKVLFHFTGIKTTEDFETEFVGSTIPNTTIILIKQP